MLFAFLLPGCGGNEWQAETQPAQGRVSINGAAPVGAVVELHSTGEQADARNSRPWGVVQEDGAYRLTTYELNDGAPQGDYAITIRWPPDVNRPSLADRLNRAYSNPKSSRWNVTVVEGDNELAPVEIKGAKMLSRESLSSRGGAAPGPRMGL